MLIFDGYIVDMCSFAIYRNHNVNVKNRQKRYIHVLSSFSNNESRSTVCQKYCVTHRKQQHATGIWLNYFFGDMWNGGGEETSLTSVLETYTKNCLSLKSQGTVHWKSIWLSQLKPIFPIVCFSLLLTCHPALNDLWQYFTTGCPKMSKIPDLINFQ